MVASSVRISLFCLAALPLFSGGCLSELAYAADSSEDAVGDRSGGGGTDSSHRDDPHRVVVDPAFARAGWIHAPASLVLPYCPAVLLDANTALATGACMDELASVEMEFGLDVPGAGPQWGVAKVSAWRDDSSLRRLTLATEVDRADSLPPMKRLSTGVYEVHLRAFAYVPADEVSWQWTWTGTLDVDGDEASLSPDDIEASGNCHGDLGAGVYLASGELVGIVTGVRDVAQCVELLDVELMPSEGAT